VYAAVFHPQSHHAIKVRAGRRRARGSGPTTNFGAPGPNRSVVRTTAPSGPMSSIELEHHRQVRCRTKTCSRSTRTPTRRFKSPGPRASTPASARSSST
jgi:hypothetical protein